ncbi:DUF58 domain-containing protein [Psychrobacillus sp. FSL K6-2684]|uniref:DUF58 domain-containing protein n=1 Tax=unclassified Psychrobacillus TaxID=2636677 RepID=UPI0012464C4C|nr:DUF58 domain-containing protein [Psychrobacillus sp. AK 1817]QEY21152.1 DUF58 domain-containing protein [Psychrobacillus sp. AK 1817]
MILTKEMTYFSSPITLSFLAVLFIIFNFLEIYILVGLIALIFSFSLLSYSYLKTVQSKVSWTFKKYSLSSSIGDVEDCYIEISNDSRLPVFNLEVQIESENEKSIVFLNLKNKEDSTTKFKVDMLPKSKKLVRVRVMGKSRGHHKWSNFEIFIKDPFRLQVFRLAYPSKSLPIFIILPRILKINDIRLQSIIHGNRMTNHSYYTDATMIMGTKIYENESFHHIHWLATAKENKIVTKKYEKVNGNEYTIFLNICGNLSFQLRHDMEELIEYAVSVYIALFKEGCKVQLLVNYTTLQNGILKVDNHSSKSQLKKMMETLALIETRGAFLSSMNFYDNVFRLKDKNSMALIIGTPPGPSLFKNWVQLKK